MMSDGEHAHISQMLKAFVGDPKDEGRMRIGDTGPRQIIQWISKAWTTHELTLPVFYRESLARILSLERFRNLIETNIEAGITLYTDHKPALFENSLSNKGQLSKCLEISRSGRPIIYCGKLVQTRGKDAVCRPALTSVRTH